jgi:large subunit ribosomal protein L24
MAKQTQAGRKPAGMKIKKGDTVVVLAGRDRGREGKVILAYPDRQRVLVQGVNIIRKNTKVNFQGARGAKEGGIVTQEAPIHVSNVALVDPDSKKPARAGYRFEEAEDGTRTKVRVSRQGGKDI